MTIAPTGGQHKVWDFGGTTASRREEQCVLTWEEELQQMTERLSVEAGAKTIDLGCSSAHGALANWTASAHLPAATMELGL
ncbi:hypothetical protein RHS01_11184 [Rhizoctonia solani]|uniref:Uncharacterized protein n=1 Tax=Rhizoctonia solani TaxID=456999 RepID=A0A8H7I0L7_9AGAM|nr:hypothetical protein RHS01_11184 [Rhizoctonia solani]